MRSSSGKATIASSFRRSQGSRVLSPKLEVVEPLVVFLSMEPYPVAGETIGQADYVATLVVTQ